MLSETGFQEKTKNVNIYIPGNNMQNIAISDQFYIRTISRKGRKGTSSIRKQTGKKSLDVNLNSYVFSLPSVASLYATS